MSMSEHFILPKNETIIIERDNSVLWIWLNRPKSKNALSATMIDEIAASIVPVDNSFSRISCFFIISFTLSTGIIKFYF